VRLGSSFPHPADVETKEVEALIDVDHLGLLRRQLQPHLGENGCHPHAQFLGMLAVSGDHDDEVVAVCRPPDSADLGPIGAGQQGRRANWSA
jgi:hypothetical protein